MQDLGPVRGAKNRLGIVARQDALRRVLGNLSVTFLGCVHGREDAWYKQTGDGDMQSFGRERAGPAERDQDPVLAMCVYIRVPKTRNGD